MAHISLRCFCKVNLCLEILGRREDGYHDLATIFQTVSLADLLSIEAPAEQSVLTAPEGGAPEGPENLCLRALAAYRELRGWPAGACLELTKRVPAGAGLGGGSSNAAATLCGLAQLDEEPPDTGTLHELAAGLGSDVPFFIEGGTALGTGRGERIEQLRPLSGLNLVLARPELSIGTAEAYGLLDQSDFTDGARAAAMAEAIRAGAGPERVAEHVHNGFTRAVVGRWPELGAVLEALGDVGAMRAEVSGSGSACFGLFPGPEAAEDAATRLQVLGIWAVAVEGVNLGWALAGEPAGEEDV